ncbi:Chromosome (plasmid) partitioning protein ParB [[Actinomadura] parvosata subsp. kistnae]|nr:Chromosome (plasmid) partitioning protein ParB [Actinomadura parvosata subsp. kistnae]
MLRIPLKYLTHFPDNVREDFGITPAFCKSLLAKQQVVLTAIPIPDDYDRQEGEEEFLFWVIKGNRRLEGGRKLQLETMLCLVDLTMVGDRAGLFIDQLVENDGDFRVSLSAFEQAQALFQAHQAGASRTELRQRTGRTRQQITAGIKAGKISEQTRRAAQAMDHAWTLDDVALLAEFDGDERALAKIQQRIDWGHPVAYAVESVRDELAEQAAQNRLVAELEQAGVRVTESRPPDALLLDSLARLVDGFDPDPARHASCAGHGAFFYSYNKTQPEYYCTTPAEHGYTPRESTTPTAAASAPSGSAEPRGDEPARKTVIEGRAAWPRAGTLRQQWLAEFFQRKNAPKPVLPFVTRMLLDMPGPVRDFLTAAHRSPLYAQFGGPADLDQALRGASTGQQAMMMLRLIAVAFEHQMTKAGQDCKNTWRPDKYSPCSRADAALWLRFLVDTLGPELGTRTLQPYQPAPIERALIDGTPYRGDVPADQTDIAGEELTEPAPEPDEAAIIEHGSAPVEASEPAPSTDDEPILPHDPAPASSARQDLAEVTSLTETAVPGDLGDAQAA